MELSFPSVLIKKQELIKQSGEGECFLQRRPGPCVGSRE